MDVNLSCSGIWEHRKHRYPGMLSSCIVLSGRTSWLRAQWASSDPHPLNSSAQDYRVYVAGLCDPVTGYRDTEFCAFGAPLWLVYSVQSTQLKESKIPDRLTARDGGYDRLPHACRLFGRLPYGR